MKKTVLLLAAALVIGSNARAGLFGLGGGDAEQQRQNIRTESKNALQLMYENNPGLKEVVKKAYGYAVFDNTNINLFLLSTASGSGLCVDNKTHKEVFMRMASLGGGVGLGARDYRVLFVFRKKAAMDQFVNDGWQLGGSANAAAKSGDKGGAIGQNVDVNISTNGANVGVSSGAQTVVGQAFQPTPDMEVYQFTKTGLSLQATIQGTKYWKDNALNQ